MAESVLYVEIFQPFAQYRNPFTFYYAQTFPLPSLSQIIGMIQNSTKKYYDLSFYELEYSVHGYFETIFWNYQQFIKGDLSITGNGELINKQEKNPLKNLYHLLYNEKSIIFKAQRSPIIQQELFNGRIFIFIKGKRSKLEEIKNSLIKPKKVLYLGRSEDIIFIRRVEFLEPKESCKKTIIKFSYPCWFKLTKDLEIKNHIKSPVYSVTLKQEFLLNNKPIKTKGQIISGKTKRRAYFEPLYLANHNKYYVFSKELNVEIYHINNKELIIPEICWISPNKNYREVIKE